MSGGQTAGRAAQTADNAVLVSVIVPVYRVEQTLERCVASIQAQDYEDLEIILVDDGSPDSCPEICDRLAREDSRITVLHQRNAGLSAARNAGVKASHGDWVAFVDSDDTVDGDYISAMLREARRTGADLVVCGYEVRQAGRPGVVRLPQMREPMRARDYVRRMFEYDDYIPRYSVAWNKLYSRALCERVPFPAGRLHEDSATFYLFADQAHTVAFVNRPLYRYAVTEGSIMHSGFGLWRFDGTLAAVEQARYLLARGYDDMVVWRCMRQVVLDCARTVAAARKAGVAGWRARWREVLGELAALTAELKAARRPAWWKRLAFSVAAVHPVVVAALLRW